MQSPELRRIACAIDALNIHHRQFECTVRDIESKLTVLQPGEVLMLVGPTRVGKSRAVDTAFCRMLGPRSNLGNEMPVVWLTAENGQAHGEFSTRGFMLAACNAVHHPIYGQRDRSDPDYFRLESHKSRTPENVLREAFEISLKQLRTKYLVIDEAHHVGYVRGGQIVASRVLDSWKCLAWKTQVVLVLSGAYKLVETAVPVPHFTGRHQRPIEFPRYKEDLAPDREAFAQVLSKYSEQLTFQNKGTSLSTWAQYLFRGSLGCVGHLSKWIRLALARAASNGERGLSLQTFEKEAFLHVAFAELLREALEGERVMRTIDLIGEESSFLEEHSSATTADRSPARRKPKPFQRKTTRKSFGGRV